MGLTNYLGFMKGPGEKMKVVEFSESVGNCEKLRAPSSSSVFGMEVWAGKRLDLSNGL